MKAIAVKEINKAIASYSGVERRQDLIKEDSDRNIYFYDDYAHHPTEIDDVTLNSFRNRFDKYKVVAIFQPHRYTRTQAFLNEFASSLSLADKCYILPLFSAGEQEIKGASSKDILDSVQTDKKFIENVTEIELENNTVYVFMGAGSISKMARDMLHG
jgi:UDP-N-acetylmuramate--alanine ligase